MLILIIGALMAVTPPIRSQSTPDVDGGWSPWELDPSIDCCVYGSFARYRRYCTNPTPERNGTKCQTTNGTLSSTEDTWRTCQCKNASGVRRARFEEAQMEWDGAGLGEPGYCPDCSEGTFDSTRETKRKVEEGGCVPACDPVISFCVNDTDKGAYCQCMYPMIKDPYFDPLNGTGTRCINSTTTTTAPVTKPPATMDPDSKKTKNTVGYICMVVMLGCLAASFALMIFCYGFKTLRVIQMSEEITLAATFALVAFLIENTGDKTLCMIIAILVHYFFMCTMTFYCLEALHTYSMVTYVVPVKGYLSSLFNIFLGLGIPLLPLALSVGFMYDQYGNNGRHCWCDISGSSTGQAWAFLFPICFGALACAVIAEAQGQGKYEPLPGTDEVELRSAKISQYTIMINMPLSVAAYVVGLLAVDLQIFALYMVFYALAVLLGAAVLFTHAASSPRLTSVCPCGSSASMAGSAVRVAPTPSPIPIKMQ